MEDYEKEKKKGFKSGERPATNLKAQKAQFFRRVYYPRKNAVVDIIRKDPSTITYDESGRIYGLMPDNPVLQALRKSSTFDDATMLEVWVFLPAEEKGVFVDRSKKRKRNLRQGDVLKLPDVGEKITLWGYQSEKKRADVSVYSFPERIFRNAKTAALVLRVSKYYDSK